MISRSTSARYRRVGSLGLALLAVTVSRPVLAHPPNIVPNGTLEKVDPSDSTKPMYWTYNKWGTASPAAFVWISYSGTNHTVHAQIFGAGGVLPCATGDVKWTSTAFPIYPGGGKYTLSDQYRGTVDSELMLEVTLTSGGTLYYSAGTFKPSATWAVAQGVVDLPAATSKVQVLHKFCGAGWLETDNYSLVQGVVSTPGLDGGPGSPDTVWPPPYDAGTAPKTDSGVGPTTEAGVKTGAVVSVVFDDGWESVYKNGFSAMKANGIRATHFIHTDYVDKAGYSDYMTSTHLKEIYKSGHEMGSHAMNKEWADKDEYLDPVKLDVQLSQSKARLESWGFSVKGFAPPGGEGLTNAGVQSKVGYYYNYQRTIEWGLNAYPYKNLYLKAYIVTNQVSLSTFYDWVDAAKKQGAWLVLLFHRIQTPASYDTEVTPTNFASMMGILAKSGLPVLPMGEVLGIWKPTWGIPLDGGGAVTPDSGSTVPVADAGGSPWGDGWPFPSTDKGSTTARDIGSLALPRPWDNDRGCSVTTGSDPRGALPAVFLLLVGLLALRRRA